MTATACFGGTDGVVVASPCTCLIQPGAQTRERSRRGRDQRGSLVWMRRRYLTSQGAIVRVAGRCSGSAQGKEQGLSRQSPCQERGRVMLDANGRLTSQTKSEEELVKTSLRTAHKVHHSHISTKYSPHRRDSVA